MKHSSLAPCLLLLAAVIGRQGLSAPPGSARRPVLRPAPGLEVDPRGGRVLRIPGFDLSNPGE